MHKENKNNDYIQQFISSVLPWRHFGEYPLNVNRVCCSVSAASCAYVVYVQIKACAYVVILSKIKINKINTQINKYICCQLIKKITN